MQNARRHAGWSSAAVVWLVSLTIALWMTGVAMHLFGHDSVAELPLWQENLQRWATVAHGVLTWLFCLMVGRWVWPHASQVWSRRSRGMTWAMGIATACACGILSLAGLGLLYGPGAWRETLSATHWWVGLYWPLVCAVHAWRLVLRRL